MLVVGIRVTALAHWSPYVYTGAGVCCCWRPLYSTAASPADGDTADVNTTLGGSIATIIPSYLPPSLGMVAVYCMI